MAIFVYIIRGITLLRFCVSNSFRAETKARWKRTPQPRVIMEVGTGILGIVAVGALITVIIVSSKK